MTKLSTGLWHMQLLEDHAQNDTIIHRLKPLTKLMLTLFYILLVVSFQSTNLSGLLVFFAYPFILLPLSETPIKLIFSRILLVLPFSVFVGLSNLILDREILFYVYQIGITSGALSFVGIIIKTTLSVISVLLFIATTPITKISECLILIKIPKLFVSIVLLIYRYLELLITEASTMYMAYRLRASRYKAIHIKHIGAFLGKLLIGTFEKGERIDRAMRCRGFSGDFYYKGEKSFDLYNFFVLLISMVILILMRFWSIVLMIFGGIFT